MRIACLPGNKVSAQLDPTLYPPDLSFGSGGAASPMQVIPMLGPASSTRGLYWKYMGGEMAPPAPELQGPQCFCCWGAKEGAAGTKGFWAQS